MPDSPQEMPKLSYAKASTSAGTSPENPSSVSFAMTGSSYLSLTCIFLASTQVYLLFYFGSKLPKPDAFGYIHFEEAQLHSHLHKVCGQLQRETGASRYVWIELEAAVAITKQS